MDEETRADIARERIAVIDHLEFRQKLCDARRARIKRFAGRQERERKFVRLSDLIDYHATEARGVEINEQARLVAYMSFAESVCNGAFTKRVDEKGRLQILFLHPDSPAIRLTAERFEILHQTFDLKALANNYLAYCWLPLECALQWCEDKKITPPPAWGRLAAQPTTASIYHTGAPGRPSAIQFVIDEWRRRRDEGLAPAKLCAEGRALHEWCRKNHPAIAPPSPRTIENRIRDEFNTWKASAQN